MSIRSQYRASLKDRRGEELLDLWLFRPPAFLLAKLLVHTPVTPNQITLAALVSGGVAGCFLAAGDRRAAILGAVLYGISNMLDCCDGMVARLKGTGSQTGRMIDVFADCLTGTFLYIGLGIGLTAAGTGLPLHPWILVVAAGISFAIQSASFDGHRNAFLSRLRNDSAHEEQELCELERDSCRRSASPGEFLRRMLAGLYVGYMRLQRSGRSRELAVGSRIDPHQHALLVRLRSLTGSTTHVTVFMIATFLDAPVLLFGYAIVLANVWCMLVALLERRMVRATLQHGCVPGELSEGVLLK